MPQSVKQQFPLLYSVALNPLVLERNIALILSYAEIGFIRNTVLQRTQYSLSQEVQYAWEALVKKPFFYAGKWENQPPNARILHSQIAIRSLPDVIVAAKQVEKIAMPCAAIRAMQQFCTEISPLAHAVIQLQNRSVKDW